jgi:hypothetical protein
VRQRRPLARLIARRGQDSRRCHTDFLSSEWRSLLSPRDDSPDSIKAGRRLAQTAAAQCLTPIRCASPPLGILPANIDLPQNHFHDFK